MKTSTLSNTQPTGSNHGGAWMPSLLLMTVVIAALGVWLAFQFPDERQSQPPIRSEVSSAPNASSASSAPTVAGGEIVWPNDETQSAFPYVPSKNTSDYQTAVEVPKRLQARDAQMLAERMRLLEAARAAGYPLTDPDFK